jgi:hypothetical protein
VNISAYNPICVGDSGSGGSAGNVPMPASGDYAAGKFLNAGCAWAVPPGSADTPTHGVALCPQLTGSGSAYTCSTSPSFTPVDGSVVMLIPAYASGASPTLSVNSSIALTLYGPGKSSIVANEFNALAPMLVKFDSTGYWFVLSPPSVLPALNGGTGTGLAQPAHYVFSGPASGSNAAPSFRALVAADIPVAALLNVSNVGTSNSTGTNWIALGNNSGMASNTSSYWTSIGYQAGLANTSLGYWTAIGYLAGYSNVSGNSWTAIGSYAAHSNSSCSYFTAVGSYAAYSSSSGCNWTAIGSGTGFSNSSGSNWTAIGNAAGSYLTTGSNWSAIGFAAGEFIADGTTHNITSSDSFYLGANTRPLADGDTYENVIGDSSIGHGSNTSTIGTSTQTGFYYAGVTVHTVLYSAAGTALPTCNASLKGAETVVSDATTPTFLGTYASGGGITAAVICSYNGSTYAWLIH